MFWSFFGYWCREANTPEDCLEIVWQQFGAFFGDSIVAAYEIGDSVAFDLAARTLHGLSGVSKGDHKL
jgi:hypothetical protein